MELGMIRKIDIDIEMQQSYLDYAMSVIVARALPDARDGLKPVQRRILYAMYDMGLRPESGYKKSARIVGEVLGKYHPHGDAAVYEAMARMAQDFSMRNCLVEGQGNFGSVDGDPPAAMRYTEARLSAVAMEILLQLDKNTVKFASNFDETLSEPEVLPAAIPNLLVNGATGIAVGMATNVPPHNLGEVVDALVLLLNRWDKMDDVNVEDLMKSIKGPDFPTGGVILQDPQGEGLAAAYATGRGRVTLQARAHLEEVARGRSRIIVTELPYMANKASLIERIAELVREGTLDGIADLRDESDRQGMRVVIELTKTAESEKTLKDLYKHTPMQITFGINMLALVNGEPHLLTLKQALRVYIEHRLEVIRRRSEYELEQARRRAHILEGLRIALKNLDEVIALIRNSPDVDIARARLIKRFKLSEIQAQAILDMPLRRLASLERKKIEEEYKGLMLQIKELEALLKSPKKMREIVITELQRVKQAYGDRRRTHIASLKEGANPAAMLTTTDLPAQDVWVGITEDGKVARTLDDNPPRQSGRDAPLCLIHTNTNHTLYLVTVQGKAAAIPVHALPEAEKASLGTSQAQVCALEEKDKVAELFSLPPKEQVPEDLYILTISKSGLVKRTLAKDLPGPSAQAFTLVRINDNDALGWARLCHDGDEVVLVSALGMGICFPGNEVRPMGLVAAGVNGIKLAVGDEVIGADILPKAGEMFILAGDGKGKRVSLADFPRQSRYGQGVVVWKLSRGVRLVGAVVDKPTQKVTVHYAAAASRLTRLDEAPQKSRALQGQLVVEVKPGDRLVGMTLPMDCLSIASAKPVKAKSPRRKAVPKDVVGRKKNSGS